MFFCDNTWFDADKGQAIINGFAGQVVTCGTRGWGDYGDRVCHVMKQEAVNGLSTDRDKLTGSWTVLDFALNLLVHLGVVRIGILGADMQLAEDGATHWHSGHPVKTEFYDLMLQSLAAKVAPLKALGIEVVNCTPGGRLNHWPRADLGEFLS